MFQKRVDFVGRNTHAVLKPLGELQLRGVLVKLDVPLKLKLGEGYVVWFLDHVEDGNRPMLFRLRGTLIKDGDEDIVLAPWDYGDPKEATPFGEDDPNRKIFSIIRSAIKKVRKLPPGY